MDVRCVEANGRRATGGPRAGHARPTESSISTRRLLPDDTLSTPVSLAELLADSGVVSLHVPLTEEIRHLISARELDAMKPTATLVSTSRGGVVDEEALLAAVSEGRLHSARLDVYERDPTGRDLSPLVAEPHIVTLPHIGSATETTRAAMVDLAVDHILDALAGHPARPPLPGGPAEPPRPLAEPAT